MATFGPNINSMIVFIDENVAFRNNVAGGMQKAINREGRVSFTPPFAQMVFFPRLQRAS